MTEFLLYFLLATLLFMIGWGLVRPSRLYQFPFLAGCVFALWAWPQFYRLHAAGDVPDNMLNKALVMTILCSGMCYFGYQRGRRPIKNLNWAFHRKRLEWAALMMTLAGLVFQYKFSRMASTMGGGHMSGIPIVYYFFADLLNFGFAIAVLLVLRQFSWWLFAIASLGAFGYLYTIVFGGRREVAIQFVLVIGLLAWFIRNKMPPRAVIICGILAGAFLSYNIDIYRHAMYNSRTNLSELKQMNAVTEEGTEMENAVYYIAATEKLGAYDFGFFHWNTLVFRYFPAQIFGATAKGNLMSLGGLLHIGDNAERAYGYENGDGTTVGGITDAFASFWYFGCLEFFAIGYFMRKLYVSAIRGSTVWQLACALMTVYSLLAITHSTNHAVAPWVQAALFLGPAFLYARAKPGERGPEIIPAMNTFGAGRPSSEGAGRAQAASQRIIGRYPAKKRGFQFRSGWSGKHLQIKRSNRPAYFNDRSNGSVGRNQRTFEPRRSA